MPSARKINGQSEVKLYNQRLGQLKNERATYDAHMQEISEYLLPRWGQFLASGQKAEEGKKRHGKVLDGKPGRYINIAASGTRAGMNSPSRMWLRLGLPDPDLSDYKPVREWLDWVGHLALRVFAISGFYNVSLSGYKELWGFGNQCSGANEDYETVTRFHHVTTGRYYIDRDYRGRVDTVYRLLSMAVRAARQRFGEENLPQVMQTALSRNPFEKYEILHVVEPNDERQHGKMDAAGKRFRSVYLFPADENTVLRRSGFDIFPYLVADFERLEDETYARSPGHDVLPDVKSLYEYKKAAIVGTHKSYNPPMLNPSKGKELLSTIPGAQNPISASEEKGYRPLYQTQPDLGNLHLLMEDTRLAIAEGLGADLFLLLNNNPNATATEILKKYEEKVVLLAPLIDRITEYLDMAVGMVIGHLEMFRMLPPLPADMPPNMPLEVEYISPLVMAQKMAGITNMDRLVDRAMIVSDKVPSAMDVVNTDKYLTESGQMLAVPADMINSQEEIQAVRRGRAEQAAQERRMEQVAATAKVAKDLQPVVGSEEAAAAPQ